jgi:uncharacterized protein YndB with AHSA1/START domain
MPPPTTGDVRTGHYRHLRHLRHIHHPIKERSMNYQTHFDVPDGRGDLTITRRFASDARRVFAAHVDPELVVRWWGPRHLTTTVECLEARPGGRWRYVQTAPDGSVHAFHGYFHLVEDATRLVTTFEYEGTPGQVFLNDLRLSEAEGVTLLVQTSAYTRGADRDAMVAAGMRDGVLDSHERLDELLEAPGA